PDRTPLTPLPPPPTPTPTPPRTTPPMSAAEVTVSEAWRACLPQAEPDVDADFYGAGGHSLLAARLALTLSEELGRTVTIGDILLGRTIRGIARRLAADDQADDRGDGPGPGHVSRPWASGVRR